MMRRTAPILLLALAFVAVASAVGVAARAQEHGVAVELKSPASLSAPPRASVVLSLEVKNEGGDTIEVVERMVVPDGWSWITLPGALTLAPGQTRVRLHAVAVPAHAAAGDYWLVFELLDPVDSSTRASASVAVRVESVAALAVETVSAPSYVAAESSYVVRFMVTNAGNGPAEVSLEAAAQEGFFLSHERKLQLAAGESRAVDVAVTSSASTRDAVIHRLTLVATAGTATARASAEVEVIPTASGEGRILLPVQVQARVGVGDGAAAHPAAGGGAFNLALAGRGHIDEENTREVAFSLGMDSDNYVRYSSPLLQVVLGNAPFGLSAFTGSLGSSALGIGVGVAPVKREGLALEASFAANKFGRIAGAALQLGVAPGWIVSLEAAAGSGGDGHGVAARAEVARGGYSLAVAWGQPGFPGRYGGGVVVDGSAELPAWGGLSVDAQVTGVRAHGDGHAWGWHVAGRLDLRYAAGGSAWLAYGYRDEDDPDSDADKFAVGITQRLGPGTVNARYDWRPGAPGDDTLRVSLDYSPTWRRDYQAYYTASGLSSGEAAHTIGAKSSLFTGLRSWAGLDISRAFGAAAQSTSIGASLRYSLTGWLAFEAEAKATRPDVGEWSLAGKLGLTATHGFSVPVGVKTSVGALTGRVFDEHGGLAGFAVRVGQFAAMTAADGTYQFKGLEPGAHYVQVDMAGLPEGSIPGIAMPTIVIIEAGATARLDIPLTRKASMTGRVMAYRQSDPRANGANGNGGANGALIEVGPLAGVMVSAVMGDEKRCATSDAEGRFTFVELRPGDWEVHVIANGRIPEGHVLDPEVQVVSVAPGGKSEVLFRVVPRPRELQMLDGGLSVCRSRPEPLKLALDLIAGLLDRPPKGAQPCDDLIVPNPIRIPAQPCRAREIRAPVAHRVLAGPLRGMAL